MIGNPYLLSSFISSIVLILCYAAVAEIRGRDRGRRLWNIVNLVLSVQGTVIGVRLIVVVFASEELGPFGVADAGYIVLGGIVVICVSFAYVYDTFRRVFGEPDDSESE